MSKLKRHRPPVILPDEALARLPTKRLLAHFRKIKLQAQVTKRTTIEGGYSEELQYPDLGYYISKLLSILNYRENV